MCKNNHKCDGCIYNLYKKRNLLRDNVEYIIMTHSGETVGSLAFFEYLNSREEAYAICEVNKVE